MEDKTKPMCRSGCGFYGNPATDGFCSFCYNALMSKEQSCLTATSITTSSAISSHNNYESKMLFVEKRNRESTTSATNLSLKTNQHKNMNMNMNMNVIANANIGEQPQPLINLKLTEEDIKSVECNRIVASEDDKHVCGKIPGRKSLRCAAKNCRRKLGLTDVQCRCGDRFCPIHRYSDRHECSFDYREFGAQEIRRKNPKVVGEKIQKI